MSREPRKISVEDLLRFKRAERPAPEFWDRFDRELRAKQLAAIVSRRPWWQWSLRGGFGRLGISLGAAAALASGILAFREFRAVRASSPEVSVTEALPAELVVSDAAVFSAPEPLAAPGFASTTSMPLAPAPVATVASAPAASAGTVGDYESLTASIGSVGGLGIMPVSYNVPHPLVSDFGDVSGIPAGLAAGKAMTIALDAQLHSLRPEPLAGVTSPEMRRLVAYTSRPTGYVEETQTMGRNVRAEKFAEDQLRGVDLSSNLILKGNQAGFRF